MLGRWFSLLLFAVALALSFAPSSPAWAGPAEAAEAKKHMQAGEKAEKNGEWKTARDEYDQAVELNETPAGRLALAMAESKLGHLMEAVEQLKLVIDHKKSNAQQKKKAKKELELIQERIPTLTVKVPPDFKGTVRIDEVELSAETLGQPVEVNPGTRVIIAESEGFEQFQKSVVLADRAQETVMVELTAMPKEDTTTKAKVDTSDGSTMRTLGFVSLGVGGAGLIVGTVFGIQARSTRDDLRAACENNVCQESQRETYDTGKMQATVSTIGFIAGGVGVGAGVILLIAAPSRKKEAAESATITPYVGPGSLGVHGTF